MFKLCENAAYARISKQSNKVLTFKATTEEVEVIREMMGFYDEVYMSNILRIALNDLYKKMQNEKNA